MEIFKTIEEYPMYSVSTEGRVMKNSTRQIMKPSRKANGYMQINLFTNDGRRKKEYVHRLVALTFLPNEQHLPQVDHIDGVRDHNAVTNLAWITPLNNVLKSSICRPIKVYRKDDPTNCKVYATIQDACRDLNLTDSNVSACLTGGRQHSHKGYQFEYWKNEEVV